MKYIQLVNISNRTESIIIDKIISISDVSELDNVGRSKTCIALTNKTVRYFIDDYFKVIEKLEKIIQEEKVWQRHQ